MYYFKTQSCAKVTYQNHRHTAFWDALSHLLYALQRLQYTNMGFNALHLILS